MTSQRSQRPVDEPQWVAAYERAPNATFARLFVPVLFSLVAEPLTGLVDTAFVARLGAAPLAALGVGVTLLSSLFWIFNFLGIGTQTGVARALGQRRREAGAAVFRQATLLAAGIGLVVTAVGWWSAPALSGWMGAVGPVEAQATAYLRIRLIAAPAVLVMMAAFGALRGAADMRAPLAVALAMNALNIALDAWWIPRFAVAGAAWATTVSQMLGASVAAGIALRRIGWRRGDDPRALARFLRIGGDIFLRTLALNAFLVLGTAVATRAGDAEGAAHQAVRQVWAFGAFLLDAYAATAQTLIAHWIGSERRAAARETAARASLWALATGIALAVAMFTFEARMAAIFVPGEAREAFAVAWWIALVFQPFNALAFVTDGIHWGSGDFAYLRRGMAIASAVGALGLLSVATESPDAMAHIWACTGLWITLRALWGCLRVWPGGARAPLGRSRS